MAENKELDAPEEQVDLDDPETEESEPVDPGKKEVMPEWAREQITKANRQAAALRVEARKAKEKLEAYQKEQELLTKTKEERLNLELAESRQMFAEMEKRAKIVEKRTLIVAQASSVDFRDPMDAVSLVDPAELSDDLAIAELEVEQQIANIVAKKPYLLKERPKEPKINVGGPVANPAPENQPPMPKFTDANKLQQMRDEAASYLNKGKTVEAVRAFEKAYQIENNRGG